MLGCGPFSENGSANLMGQVHELPEEGGGGVQQLFPCRPDRCISPPVGGGRGGGGGWFGSEELQAWLNVGWATRPRYDWRINIISLNLAWNYLLGKVLNKLGPTQPGTVV
jgi:hypothetical protein